MYRNFSISPYSNFIDYMLYINQTPEEAAARELFGYGPDERIYRKGLKQKAADAVRDRKNRAQVENAYNLLLPLVDVDWEGNVPVPLSFDLSDAEARVVGLPGPGNYTAEQILRLLPNYTLEDVVGARRRLLAANPSSASVVNRAVDTARAQVEARAARAVAQVVARRLIFRSWSLSITYTLQFLGRDLQAVGLPQEVYVPIGGEIYVAVPPQAEYFTLIWASFLGGQYTTPPHIFLGNDTCVDIDVRRRVTIRGC